jgi:Holliday junction resolvasome RuvABC endonuclease subunit
MVLVFLFLILRKEVFIIITLSLDLSTKSSGWAIFENTELQDYGCITAASTNLFNRIEKMITELNKIVDKYNPDKVIVEDVLPEDVRHNQNTFKALIYLQAIIAYEFNKKGKNLEFYTSSEWRKKCGIQTGRGIKRDTLKQADINFVKEHYNKNVNDDVADAICIGFAYTNKPIPVKKTNTKSIIIDGFEFR